MWNLPVHSNLGRSQIIYTTLQKMKHQVAGLEDEQNFIFSGNYQSFVAVCVLATHCNTILFLLKWALASKFL